MISARKINAIFSKNMKNIVLNPFIIVSPIMIALMAYLMGHVLLPDDAPVEVIGYMMSMVISMNMIMCGVMIMSVLIAEEKEKNTLGVLITSTVSSLDFLISNVLTTALITILLNAGIYFLITVEGLPFGGYMLVTSAGTIAAITLGASLGLLAKNQAAASTMVTPLMLLALMPMFFPGSFFVDNVLYYVFTEQVDRGMRALVEGGSILLSFGIIAVNIAVFAILFVVCYRKRGLAV